MDDRKTEDDSRKALEDVEKTTVSGSLNSYSMYAGGLIDFASTVMFSVT